MTGSYMLLRNAFKIYVERDNYAYFYGAKNTVLTDAIMNDLIKIYWKDHFSRYDEKMLNRIRDYSRGKIGLDCSGFITLISGLSGNSKMLYDRCSIKTSPENGPAGSLLYKPGHCGIDIGYGYTMDCPIELHTLEISKIQSRGFTGSGLLPGYDYKDANNY